MISVDTSGEWVSTVTSRNPKTHRLNIFHADLGNVGRWGRPLSYEFMQQFSSYTDYIWKQDQTPELILIDGRFRVCCFLTTLKFAKKGTKILFDDYLDRPYYHFVEKHLKWSRACGRQCLFIVPDKTMIDMTELERDIASFRNVMD